MNELIAVFIGGGLGSMLRFGISQWLGQSSSGFPWATFWANAASCLVMGVAIYLFSKRLDLSAPWQSMVLVGFCGGFSTFSTFSKETFQLFDQGQALLAILYVLSSVLLCITILWLFYRIAT